MNQLGVRPHSPPLQHWDVVLVHVHASSLHHSCLPKHGQTNLLPRLLWALQQI